MATRKFLDLDGLKEYDALIKTEIEEAVSDKASSSHDHDDRYYTETEIDAQLEDYVAKQDTPYDGMFIYATDDYIDYNDKKYPLIQAVVGPATPYTIPIRAAGSGAVRVGEPVENADATTKNYVDTKLTDYVTNTTLTNTLDNYITGNTYSQFANSQIEKDNEQDSRINSIQDFVEGLGGSLNTQYYTKTQIDAMEFITTDDIDEICGSTVYDGTVVIS